MFNDAQSAHQLSQSHPKFLQHRIHTTAHTKKSLTISFIICMKTLDCFAVPGIHTMLYGVLHTFEKSLILQRVVGAADC